MFSGWCFVCGYCYWFWLLVVYLIAGLDGCLVPVFGLLASVWFRVVAGASTCGGFGCG